jgi:DNA-binding GntR family transcriptional regulator
MTDEAHNVNKLQNVADYIAVTLEKNILLGKIQSGTRLIQTEIAEQFGVSRLPVRDALRTLESKELVTTLPRRGVIVREFSAQEIRDLYEMRFLLETYALGLTIKYMTKDYLDFLEEIIKEQEEYSPDDAIGFLQLDATFHRSVFSKCPNEQLRNAIDRLWNRIKLFRAQELKINDWRELSIKRHRRLLTLLREGNIPEAKRCAEQTIIQSQNDIISVVDPTLTDS